ncbi:methyl-accepting chemotaxis protein [Rhodoplanes sp. SY1]|uniref:methyl-accepting chemotaxis protein n=1 Tax=Rhodoplanes sp. SY1 TaxID=3166646 RepID=UPI0038B5601A
MSSRLSTNVLLTSVIALMASIIVLVLATGAFEAWRTDRTATRLADTADASRQMFRAMAALRVKQSFTARALNTDGMPDPGQVKLIAQSRGTAMPALRETLTILPKIDFPGRDALVGDLARLTDAIDTFDKRALEDFGKPKAQRQQGLAKEFLATSTALIATLDKIGNTLTVQSRNEDAVVDQMMAIKDAAWLVRAEGGDISIVISNALAFKNRIPPETVQTVHTRVGRTEAAWQLLESAAVGIAPGSPVATAMAKAKAAYFAPELGALRERVLAAGASGQPLDVPLSAWDAAQRLMVVVALAETALDAASDHAQAQVATARTTLVVRLALLVGALALAAGGIVMVRRRVIRPLQGIRTAMVQVADGDLATEVPYLDRRDEIGSLAAALATFKQNALEKAGIEAEQSRRRETAAQRQQAIEHAITEFEAGIGEALQALGSAAGEMRRTSETLTTTAEQTNGQARDAATSSDEASQNVQTVAAASEELSSSIGEISRQVTHAAVVAKRAVTETQETDATVQGLTDAAHKIGEIVSLITAIASQTNLLALNATIEAVVASEVKNLAGQTAKATEDISGQIGAIQEVADRALAAMRRIGATITEVSTVASSIAAAVEEQGAATAEITRNTQEAARRTQSLSDNIAGVRSCADQTGTAAGGVRSSAAVLNEQADKLRSEVDSFLTKIRAA